MIERTSLTAVVMAKEPRPGQVKTRLVTGGLFDEDAAARFAAALLRCTLHRLQACFDDVVLAASPDGAAGRIARSAGATGIRLLDQGEGDLGDRLDRVWKCVDPDHSVAFFGSDSPDVPLAALQSIPAALSEDPIALGPTPDGGYWTLAARRYLPEVLREIDWGSDRVYDQTCRRAREAGLSIAVLTPWPDVDEPDDVTELRRRLTSLPPEQRVIALQDLAETIGSLLERRVATGMNAHDRI